MTVDMQKAAQAIEEMNTAFAEMKSTNDARIAELEQKGSADVLFGEKLDKIEADIQRAEKIADEAVLSIKRAEKLAMGQGPESELEEKAASFARQLKPGAAADFTSEKLVEYKAAFDRYLRTADDRLLSGDELKTLSVGSNPDGGYTVHPDMSGRVSTRIFDTSPIEAYANVQTISTSELEGMYDDDEATTGWVNETASRPETDTPELGVWRIPVHEIYAKPKATQRILDDSEINIESWLVGKIGDKMSRTQATSFVSGDGVSQPRGFTTYDDGTSMREQIEQFDTGVNGGFKASPDAADTLIDALYSLQAEYMRNATWFMNRSTMAGLRKEKDTDGRMIWQPSMVVGQPSTLLGYAVAPAFEDMATYTTTGALAIAVGDMNAAYQIVRRQGMRLLRDPYSSKPFIEFYATQRVGGGLINGHALKLVKFAA